MCTTIGQFLITRFNDCVLGKSGQIIANPIIAKVNQVSRVILGKQLKVEGVLVYRWYEQWPPAFKEMADYMDTRGMVCYVTVGKEL